MNHGEEQGRKEPGRQNPQRQQCYDTSQPSRLYQSIHTEHPLYDHHQSIIQHKSTASLSYRLSHSMQFHLCFFTASQHELNARHFSRCRQGKGKEEGRSAGSGVLFLACFFSFSNWIEGGFVCTDSVLVIFFCGFNQEWSGDEGEGIVKGKGEGGRGRRKGDCILTAGIQVQAQAQCE